MLSLKNQKLLVIAPHPDDEVIGCGGLIRKIKDEGGKVYVLFLTVGDTKDFTKKGLSTLSERINEIEHVSKLLTFDKYDIALTGNERHLKLDTFGQKRLMDIIERKSKVSIEKIKPTMLAFPSSSSYNQDHRISSLAAHAAMRPASTRHKHFIPIVLAYEEAADTWNMKNREETNFFLSLNRNQLNEKLKALGLYKSQLRSTPNLRAIKTLKALAILRGAQSSSNFAEGFTAYRIVT